MTKVRWNPIHAVVWMSLMGALLCGRAAEPLVQPPLIRGQPIKRLRPATNATSAVTGKSARTNAAAATNATAALPLKARAGAPGFAPLGFETLGDFPYEVTEIVTEGSGRPLTKPVHEIPAAVKKLDGRKVAIAGFLFPLRIKNGVSTEFLLMRDQAACCFGQSPQINHWIRVKMIGAGVDVGPQPYVVSGTLRVGEKYVQEYLTGIYEMDGEKVEEVPDP